MMTQTKTNGDLGAAAPMWVPTVSGNLKAIVPKLCAVMRSAGYVQKDGENTHFDYTFASAGAVYAKVRAAMVENNLAVVGVSQELVKYVRQGRGWKSVVRTTVTICDGDSGALACFQGLGAGCDNQDKDVMKADTASLKYVIAAMLFQSWGDDPEVDEAPPPKKHREPEATAAAKGKLKKDGTPRKLTKKELLLEEVAAVTDLINAAEDEAALREVKPRMMAVIGKKGADEVRDLYLDKMRELKG